MGYCHSIEIWCGERIVGGLYGLSIGAAFFGESMFSLKPNASKVALVYLVASLKQEGFVLLDSQFPNKHLAQFGAVDITREEYKNRLSFAVNRERKFPAQSPDLYYVLEPEHFKTQTS